MVLHALYTIQHSPTICNMRRSASCKSKCRMSRFGAVWSRISQPPILNPDSESRPKVLGYSIHMLVSIAVLMQSNPYDLPYSTSQAPYFTKYPGTFDMHSIRSWSILYFSDSAHTASLFWPNAAEEQEQNKCHQRHGFAHHDARLGKNCLSQAIPICS